MIAAMIAGGARPLYTFPVAAVDSKPAHFYIISVLEKEDVYKR